jgi:hypothetical protein
MAQENLYPWLHPSERLTLLLEAMARGDETEADRLHSSCPRKTYVQQDAAFNGRLSLAFEMMTLLCIDLRCMWGKLQALKGCLLLTRQFAIEQHLNTAFAFVDGVRSAEGLSQMDWFAQPPTSIEQERKGREEDVAGGDEPSEPEEVDDQDSVGDCPRLEEAANEYVLRMAAAEERAERSTETICGMISERAQAVAQDLVNTWGAFDRFCQSRLGISAEGMLKAWEFPLEEFRCTLKEYESVKPEEVKVEEMFCGICTHWDERYTKEGKERNHGR